MSKELVVNCAWVYGNIFNGILIIGISADNCDFVAEGDIRHVGNVNDGKIHANIAHYWAEFASNFNESSVGQSPVQSLAVPERQDCQKGRIFDFKRAVVSNFISSLMFF